MSYVGNFQVSSVYKLNFKYLPLSFIVFSDSVFEAVVLKTPNVLSLQIFHYIT